MKPYIDDCDPAILKQEEDTIHRMVVYVNSSIQNINKLKENAQIMMRTLEAMPPSEETQKAINKLAKAFVNTDGLWFEELNEISELLQESLFWLQKQPKNRY